MHLLFKLKKVILLGEKVNDVLVTGATGGVGRLAVMVLTKMGYNVTAVDRKPDKADYLKSLGAKNIINSKEFDKDPRPIDKGTMGWSSRYCWWKNFSKCNCSNKTKWNHSSMRKCKVAMN